MMIQFVYLHGFASSPQSQKAMAFTKRFAELGLPLTVPDLEGGDFKHLTISRQLKIIEKTLDSFAGISFALIGSSMGGYLAALTAQIRPEVKGAYLMCPGYNFMKRWRSALSGEIQKEGGTGLIQVFNYRYNKTMELDLGIFEDAEKWEGVEYERPVPTRIVHGIHDDTVDIEESRNFARKHPWASLKEVDSDHGLLSHLDWIIDDCLNFFDGQGLLSV
ncbi:MAG: YqiA/YcfP family alpha/beta fold hydrolase [Nitrospinaceae bacterium]